jgi:hypothetical protein
VDPSSQPIAHSHIMNLIGNRARGKLYPDDCQHQQLYRTLGYDSPIRWMRSGIAGVVKDFMESAAAIRSLAREQGK